MGDTTTRIYQLIYDKNDNSDTKIIQYLILHGLGLCIKVDSYVAHMFYARSFSNNVAVPISIYNNKYFLSLNSNTTIFVWRAGNYNKNITYKLYSLI